MSELLVTGAAGKLGQFVLGHLLDTLKVAPSKVTAATRDPAKLSEWAKRGVTVVKADFDDATSLDSAFKGVKRLLLISTDTLGVPGTRLAQHQGAIAAAKRAGVQHIIYTSLPAADTSLVAFAPDHAGTEKAIAESGIPGWTILRNHWYAENLFMSLPQVIASGGQWYSAAEQGKIPYLPREDFGRAAASALASDFAGKRTLTISGPKAYSAEQIAALVSKATGKPIAVVHVPLEGLVQGMIGHGLPEPLARTFASFDAAAAAGHFDIVTGDYQALTGVEPTAFETWLAANARGFTAA